jgi:hypothetical protein
MVGEWSRVKGGVLLMKWTEISWYKIKFEKPTNELTIIFKTGVLISLLGAYCNFSIKS